ncbi:dynein axonemal intermediate chain 7 isoform X1 [Pleurodeles waltl]|uniref:dynein axonemal intermediate chain 7 isoform X1 n=1 Tax=Pleurodeles waltl TaxID=8319 RepID=UPI0037099B2B
MSSKGTSAGSKKKGKLSKAERLKLLKEEEERRLKEEEEAHLLAEKLEAERLERERLAKEERERLEAKELEHREEELAELQLLSGDKFSAAEKWKSEIRANAKWKRYMKCDGSPDPTIPQEINTFITLWKNEQTEYQSINLKIHLALKLIEKLEFLLSETPPHELLEKDVAHYKDTIRELQAIIYTKYNKATEAVLQHASALADIETGNMQQIIKDENGTLRIWANLNKNPRFKGYDFPDGAFGFDLPRPMAMSSIALRILHTYYDHISQDSSTYAPPAKSAEESKEEPALHLESIGENVSHSEGEEDKSGAEIIQSSIEETKSDGRKSSNSMNATSAKEETKGLIEDNEKSKEDLDSKTEDHTEDIAEVNESTPGMDYTAPGTENKGNEDEAIQDGVVDLRQFTPLGGLYYLHALKLPPQAKQVNGWTMLELVEEGMQFYPYPPNTVSTGEPKEEKENNISTYPPVGIRFKLPRNVVFFEEPQVARWDPEGKNWTTDNVLEQIYKKEEKMMHIQMDSFQTFTLFQDAHLNMPYESWELTPKGENEVAFAIYAAFTEVKIDIKDSQCRLLSLSNVEGMNISRIMGKWMSPFALKTAMKRAGINVFPEVDSDRYVSINKKDEQTEKTAYEQLAILSPSFAFSWSQWNVKCDYKQIIVKVAESLKTEQIKDEDWSLYLLSPQRACRLQMTESSEEFADDLYEDSELHSTLFHMIKCYASDAAIERIKNSHYLFVDCVYQLLNYTRVLTYS